MGRIVGADLRVCPTQGTHAGAPLHVSGNQGTHAGVPLPKIVQWFKTMTTNEYIRGVKEMRWAPFSKRLWQRNYYEHIIRDEESLNHIREYILTNPIRWHLDKENPQRVGDDEFDLWLSTFEHKPVGRE